MCGEKNTEKNSESQMGIEPTAFLKVLVELSLRFQVAG